MLPTVDWMFPHQLPIKTTPHRYDLSPSLQHFPGEPILRQAVKTLTLFLAYVALVRPSVLSIAKGTNTWYELYTVKHTHFKHILSGLL